MYEMVHSPGPLSGRSSAHGAALMSALIVLLLCPFKAVRLDLAKLYGGSVPLPSPNPDKRER